MSNLKLQLPSNHNDARAHVKYLRGINAPENGIARSLAVMMVL